MIARIAGHRSAHRAFCQSVDAKLTVPTHLVRIMSKTGTRRQAELVRLLSSLFGFARRPTLRRAALKPCSGFADRAAETYWISSYKVPRATAIMFHAPVPFLAEV